jgi:hypothetical protein
MVAMFEDSSLSLVPTQVGSRIAGISEPFHSHTQVSKKRKSDTAQSQ